MLQRQCGVRYNPKWQGIRPDGEIPRDFGRDSRDIFIHAIVDGVGGTCGSLPALYVAVGRRLGYPLTLVKAARHLFARWDDPEGKHWFHRERFNIEASGPGVHMLPDEHYLNWPHSLDEKDLQAGIFLKSLPPREELAEFLATRGHCLVGNGRLQDAADAFAEASRLAPHNRYFDASMRSLQIHVELRRRGHGVLNAPVHGADELPPGPFWVEGLGGRSVLVQLPSLSLEFRPTPRISDVSLVCQHVVGGLKSQMQLTPPRGGSQKLV